MDGKINGWKPGEKQDIRIVSKYFVTIFYILQGQKNLTAEKPGRYHLIQVININVTGNKIFRYHTSLDIMHLRKAQYHFYSILARKCLTLIESWKNVRQTQPEKHLTK